MGKICEVCGKPSGMYPLCKDCFKLKEENKVEKCENCGKWHLTEEPCCEVRKERTEEKTNNFEPFDTDYDRNYESVCIICGKEANGYLFCKDCFYKYKDKSILLKVTNCEEIELCQVLDNHEEGLIHKCED